ncbi:MAG: septation ring formation regulator EzrA [Erysipelotrichaceae bacterium]|nr:septation ring formation regulator EzrA [Erysipelotrichaceae bacterium]
MGNIDNNTIIILIGVLVAIIAIIVILIIFNNRKDKLKKEIDSLYVRFNAIKTAPLAFKLTKAQAMAKRNEQMSKSVQEYYTKFEETEKRINEVQDMMDNVDDLFKTRKYKDATNAAKQADEKIKICEEEVKDIDSFLDEFSKRENQQREYASKLKEDYRVVKETINANAKLLSISYNGFMDNLKECEDLFASSEEWMYANDYSQAQAELEEIDNFLESIKKNANAVPKLIKETRGVLPIMLDEANREYSLTKQRCINIDHLEVEEKLKNIETTLKEDLAKLSIANTEGVKDNVTRAKEELNSLTEALNAENRSYKEAKETNDKAYQHIQELEKVENYVRVAYDKDSQRFGLDSLNQALKKQRAEIEKYKEQYADIQEELTSATKPASQILLDAEKLVDVVENDMKQMFSYKTVIDRSNDGENRASTQLTKLQLVVSEVESKIEEYNLPSIADEYSDDLKKSREYIGEIRKMLNEIPIDIDALNSYLDEAIDFIYKFYNNVNNIVGMAIMVENAIVFGNKYRSSYPEIDSELSKAEFQYINGEYTKALKTAISCMETLFPDNADQKILETM